MALIKNKKIIIILIIFWLFSRIIDVPVFAQGTGQILPPCAETGDCSLCGFLMGFANIATWLLTILGSVALLFFIYGGVVWLTAAGKEDKIKSGRDIIVNTVVGVVIVMAAWAIINFTIIGLVGAPLPNQPAKIFSTQPWYQFCEGESQYLPGTEPTTSTPPTT